MKKSSLGRRPPGAAGGSRKLSDFQDRRERSAIPMSVARQRNPSADRMSHLNSQYPPTFLGQTPSTSRPARSTIVSTDSSRHSSYGGKSKKESRPIHEKEWQMETVHQIQDYLRNDQEGSELLRSYTTIKNLSLNSFLDIFNFFLRKLDCNTPLANKANYLSEMPSILRKMDYKGKMDKSVLQTVNAMHSWPYALGILQFMAELVICMDAFNANCMDAIYSNDFKEQDPDQDECEFSGRSMCEYLRKSYELEHEAIDGNDLQRRQEKLVVELLAENGYSDELFSEVDALKEKCIQTEKQCSYISAKLNSVTAEYESAKESFAAKEAGKEAVIATIDELTKTLKNVTTNIQEAEKEIVAIKNEIKVKDQLKQRAQQEGVEIKATHDAVMKEKAEWENLQQSIECNKNYIQNLEEVLFQESTKLLNFKSEVSNLLMEYNNWIFSMLNLVENADKAVLLNDPTKISAEQIDTAKDILLKIQDILTQDIEVVTKEISELKLNQEQVKIRTTELEEECELKQHELNKSEKSMKDLIEEHEQKKQHLIEEVQKLEETIINLKNEKVNATERSTELQQHVSQLKLTYESRTIKLEKIIENNNKKIELLKRLIVETHEEIQKYLSEKQKEIEDLNKDLSRL